MPVRLAPVAVLLLLAALALAACGGDDGEDAGARDGGGGGAQRLTREQFVAQGARACRDSSLATRRAAEDLARDPRIRRLEGTAQETALVRRLLPVTRRGLERLATLRPPQALAGDLRRFTATLGEVYDVFPRLLTAAERGDRRRAGELTTRLTELAARSRGLAGRLGLRACLPENTP